MSPRMRKLIEKVFGWVNKASVGQRETRHRGLD
jgi:hypothetical protein